MESLVGETDLIGLARGELGLTAQDVGEVLLPATPAAEAHRARGCGRGRSVGVGVGNSASASGNVTAAPHAAGLPYPPRLRPGRRPRRSPEVPTLTRASGRRKHLAHGRSSLVQPPLHLRLPLAAERKQMRHALDMIYGDDPRGEHLHRVGHVGAVDVGPSAVGLALVTEVADEAQSGPRTAPSGDGSARAESSRSSTSKIEASSTETPAASGG